MSGSTRRGGITGWLRAHPGPAALGIVGGLGAIVVGSWLGTVIIATRDASSPSAEPTASAIVAASVEPTPLAPFVVASPSPTPSTTETASPRSTTEPSEATAEETPAPEVAPTATPTPTAAAAAVATATPRPAATPVANPPASDVIAFHADGDIWTVAPDGSGLTNLTQTPDIEEANATWSADGALLAFQSHDDGGGVDVMRADGSERRRVADGFPRNSGYHTSAVQWSPSEHVLAIAFVSRAVSIVDVDDGERRDVGTGDRYVDWSPSGRFLAWADRGRIVVHDTRLESTRAVIGMDANVSWVNWFPAEDSLLFAGFDDTGAREMHSVNLDGSGLATVLPAPDTYEDGLQLAPDGRLVLFTRAYSATDARDDDVAIFALGAADASTVLPVTGQGVARWAPDGSRAVAERDGRIFVLGLDGSEPSEIAAGYAPDWRPES